MSFEPTPTQALLLFGLLARHGECKQAELMPAILAKDREALVAVKLIGMVKEGRTFCLTLTDAGWGWAGDHLAAELPPAHGTLHDLLARLGDHLAKSGETLADFVGSKPEDAETAARRKAAEEKQRAAEEKERLAREKREAAAGRKREVEERKEQVAREKQEKAEAKEAKDRAASEKKERLAREKQEKAEAKARAAGAKPATKRKPAKPKAPTNAALRKCIGEAYLAITGGKKNESVKLSRLRTELADLDRATLDAALGRILQGDKKASLMRHDDPRQIDKADAEAAFQSAAGDPFHVLWIAS